MPAKKAAKARKSPAKRKSAKKKSAGKIKAVGSMAQVMHGTAKHTIGGLTKANITVQTVKRKVNGKVKTVKLYKSAKKIARGKKNMWPKAVAKAHAKLVKAGTISKKQFVAPSKKASATKLQKLMYVTTHAIYSEMCKKPGKKAHPCHVKALSKAMAAAAAGKSPVKRKAAKKSPKKRKSPKKSPKKRKSPKKSPKKRKSPKKSPKKRKSPKKSPGKRKSPKKRKSPGKRKAAKK